ncbi:MAG: hypothetical protein FWD57_14300 [Polyangiaceae bacterium]|nr:hypothetical protein [Polyangiaceae bacterium]
MDTKNLKLVYTITERGERNHWVKIGVAYVNRDGSLNVKLEALPINGTMHVRDWTAREDLPAPPDFRRPSSSSRNTSSKPVDHAPNVF